MYITVCGIGKEVLCMILIDNKIKELIKNHNIITNVEIQHIGAISYDLTIKEMIYQCDNKDKKEDTFLLKPYSSVIVSTIETINMPNNLVGKIIDKNSQIRRGLLVSAPVYQPVIKSRIVSLHTHKKYQKSHSLLML